MASTPCSWLATSFSTTTTPWTSPVSSKKASPSFIFYLELQWCPKAISDPKPFYPELLRLENLQYMVSMSQVISLTSPNPSKLSHELYAPPMMDSTMYELELTSHHSPCMAYPSLIEAFLHH